MKRGQWFDIMGWLWLLFITALPIFTQIGLSLCVFLKNWSNVLFRSMNEYRKVSINNNPNLKLIFKFWINSNAISKWLWPCCATFTLWRDSSCKNVEKLKTAIHWTLSFFVHLTAAIQICVNYSFKSATLLLWYQIVKLLPWGF